MDATRDHGDAVAPLPEAPLSSLLFRSVELPSGEGPFVFSAEVSRTAPGDAVLELRADDPRTGPLLARLTVRSTGGRYDWTTVSTTVTGALDGVHDLHLVLHGEQRVAEFTVSRAED